MQARHSRSNFFQLLLVGVTFILITVTGIIFRQPFLRILPLYNSLIVMLLYARVNRFAYLFGGLNSLLYAYVYIVLKLYGSLAYAVCVSFPIQIASFILWSKAPWGQSTILKRLTGKQRCLLCVGFAAAWAAVMAVLSALGSSYQILDTTITLAGIFSSILSMLAYIEYAYLSLINSVASIILYTLMLRENPGQITYLVFTLYSMVCWVLSLNKATRLYRLQQESKS